ncbi:transposase, mutator family protein [Nitzschia inconspicua]|uniref:Transposase, mutator family protein n=1 Tax=Nitzschia inconspicua TaxID=303405 RepID=A0A9K3LTB2_9STRA|nr:transposase, mutator family protein [Nitzschia inconspicua]
MLRRRTKPVVAAKPNGPLWIAEDPFRGDRALLVDDDAVAPLSGDNHLSTALVDYLLQRSLQPKNIRQRCSHYKDNKFEFVSPFCIDHHFVVVKIVFDLRSPDIFHEVSVYDSLIKGGRRNNSVHRNSPPAKYLRSFQQFIANFCSFGNPKCEVLLANPDLIMEKAVYRSCPLQQNGFDCGLFAFGCVLHLLKGLDVSADIFNQTKTQREKQQASFGLIMSYLHHFQLRNEDSTVRAESDADQRLRRLGICPGFMKHSLRHVRPVLSLDGAHLTSRWKGTLYIASVHTACNDIYPVSFAIMKDGEDTEGWKWFLELLVQAVPLLKMQHPDNRCKFCYFTFISDRQKGLIQALQQVFPDNHHCFCSVHIARNVEKEVGKQVAKHVYALSATFSKRESDELMAKINAISVRGRKYLEDITANQWRSTAWVDDPTLPPRFGIVTTNMSESAHEMFGEAERTTQPFHPGLAL